MSRTFTEEPKRELTEPEAIRQAQGGAAAAFEYLYKVHFRRVYSVCLRMIKNPAEAEDLTQKAFLQLFRKIGTFRGESGFSTWLHRVTVNIVLMHLRRNKPAEIPVEDLECHSSNHEVSPKHGPSDTSMLGAIERLHLMRAIRKLPAGCKRLFLLHDVMGTGTAILRSWLDARLAALSRRCTRPVRSCSRCYPGNKGKRGTKSLRRRAEIGPSPKWDRKDTQASRID